MLGVLIFLTTIPLLAVYWIGLHWRNYLVIALVSLIGAALGILWRVYIFGFEVQPDFAKLGFFMGGAYVALLVLQIGQMRRNGIAKVDTSVWE